jgi:hypothetical protein
MAFCERTPFSVRSDLRDEESDEMPSNRTPLPAVDNVVSRSESREDTSLQRTVAIVGLLGIALIHLLDLPGKLEETPYLGVAFIGLIVASVFLAWLLATRDDRNVWLAAGGLAGAVIVGYAINRTVGMPGAMEDIGNWLEPLGVASLFVEGTVVLVAVLAVRRS